MPSGGRVTLEVALVQHTERQSHPEWWIVAGSTLALRKSPRFRILHSILGGVWPREGHHGLTRLPCVAGLLRVSTYLAVTGPLNFPFHPRPKTIRSIPREIADRTQKATPQRRVYGHIPVFLHVPMIDQGKVDVWLVVG